MGEQHITRLAAGVLATCRRHPLLTGTLCAGSKGALADIVSQVGMQGNEYRPQRTLAFTMWNAAYCGYARWASNPGLAVLGCCSD